MPDERIDEGFCFDIKSGLFLVYVGGEFRAAAKNQVEAARLYEEVRK